MGRNGIKEKAPSGAISALMRGGGAGTRWPLLPHSLQKVQDPGLWDKWGALHHTLSVRGVWPQLLLQATLQETNVAPLHTCTADLAALPLRYELHPPGRKHAHNTTQLLSVSSSPATNRWKEYRFSRGQKGGRFCKLQIGEVNFDP